MNPPRSSRLESAAHIAEIVGAAAVVVSLVYVGSEISQNTHAVEQSNQAAALEMGFTWDSWLKDIGFAETYVQANGDPTQLSDAQRAQIVVWIGEGLNIWEFVFLSQETDLFEEETFEAWNRYFGSELRDRAIWRSTWDEIRHSYRESFQFHVDSILTLD